jgi:drug/metabolite transporter (DMT)-like permease
MRNLSSKTEGLIAINIAAVIFGSAALFGKLDVSPFWIVAMRGAFAALALGLVGSFRKDIAAPPRSMQVTILMTGIILAVHWLTFFASVQWAGVAVATLSFAVFPLFSVLIDAGLQKRMPRFAEIMAGVAIIVAVGLLVNPQSETSSLPGILAGLTSALTFATFGHSSKHIGRTLSPLRISFYQNAVVALSLVPFLFFVTPAPQQAQDWLWLILLGVVTTALMHQLYFYSLRRLSANTCSGFVALEPVYAILFAALFFHEPITLWVVASAVLIIGASLVLLKHESGAKP